MTTDTRSSARHSPSLALSFTLTLALLAGGASSLGAAEPVRPVLLDGVAAHVNRHIVTVGDVLLVMESDHRELVARYTGTELRRRLQAKYKETLNSLVERFVVLDAYENGEGRIPDWAVDKRADEVIRDQFDGDRGALLEALSHENMTYEDWRQRIRQQMIVASMRSTSVEQNVNVSPDDVSRYYAAHRNKYVSAERVHLRVIVVAKGTGAGRSEAEAVWARVAGGGEDFGAVAKAVSVGSKAEEGGDWGWVDPSILKPELAAVAQAIKPGSVSDVIASDQEFYILKVEDRRAAVEQTLAEVQTSIENELKLDRSQQMYRAWVERLKQDAYVKVFDVNLF
ncbi:MAG: peptidyl-prolyl cis-trans isomerase [Lentisphaerae bacterium]|nr:peptidyl-prolyl cis-trans isomerase [Lentisphaerota bacterium]